MSLGPWGWYNIKDNLLQQGCENTIMSELAINFTQCVIASRSFYKSKWMQISHIRVNLVGGLQMIGGLGISQLFTHQRGGGCV